MNKASIINQITALVRAGKLKGKQFNVSYGDFSFVLYDFEPFGRDSFTVRRLWLNNETWQPYDKLDGYSFVEGYLKKMYSVITSDVVINKNLF